MDEYRKWHTPLKGKVFEIRESRFEDVGNIKSKVIVDLVEVIKLKDLRSAVDGLKKEIEEYDKASVNWLIDKWLKCWDDKHE